MNLSQAQKSMHGSTFIFPQFCDVAKVVMMHKPI
jgi:hypothetical protein